jgi:hypothetical protein
VSVRTEIAEALDARFGACWIGDTRERLIEALCDEAWRSNAGLGRASYWPCGARCAPLA